MIIPTSGKVFVNGMDTSDENLTYKIREKVGLVLQNPDNQLIASIVEEDVAFGPENLGLSPKEIRKRVDNSLIAVGMYEYRKNAPHKLSGGQKQRVAIAGIIAMKPSCIVLDEPTSMLDPAGRKDVIETIKQLNKELGITVILITHYMDEAIKSDRVIVMSEGKILIDGAPREVFSNVRLLKENNLDIPQPTKLVNNLKLNGINMPCGILNNDECIESLEKILSEYNRSI
jgi:energy-coupling factor transport system ATP-binding protein